MISTSKIVQFCTISRPRIVDDDDHAGGGSVP